MGYYKNYLMNYGIHYVVETTTMECWCHSQVLADIFWAIAHDLRSKIYGRPHKPNFIYHFSPTSINFCINFIMKGFHFSSNFPLNFMSRSIKFNYCPLLGGA